MAVRQARWCSRGIYHSPPSTILADDDQQCSALGNSAVSWGAKAPKPALMGGRLLFLGAVCLDRLIIWEPTPYHTKTLFWSGGHSGLSQGFLLHLQAA